MTQTKNENPDHPRLEVGEEPEDFSKIIKTESGHLAIVDASILRNSEHPAASQAIIFATKQSPGQEVAFKISGEYDDAILRTLTMVPAELEEVQQHEQQKANKEGPEQSKDKMQQEHIQVRGHDRIGKSPVGSSVDKKLSRIERVAQGNKGSRQHRNKQDSAKPDPNPDPAGAIDARMVERGSIKGAQRDNYGQPRSKKSKEKTEVESFIKHVNGNTVTVEFLNGMEHSIQIHEGLCKLRREIVEGKIKGNLGLVHRACSILEEHRGNQLPENMKLIENLLREGLPLV